MILGDNMDAILISYHGVSDGYIKVVVDILKNHNFFIAPQSIIDDETVTIREYICTTNEHLFKPKHAAAVMLDDMTRREYPPVRYITNKIVYNGNYKWKSYFIRCDDNRNVVGSCDECPYCIDEISVSRFICNKLNREIGYASQQTFPKWCPLTDGWRT